MSPKIQQPQTDPRIAPKEMIVTRRKSALQKRQLRVKDRSMRSITQLLKSPIRRSQSSKKQKLTPKAKSPKKKAQSTPKSVEEISPKPLERRPKLEKDRKWLKPKHNFKMVAKTNKRKLCAPRREMDPGSVSAAPSPTDMSRLVEDSESLDEEGLLEILTCPSPVWWEDPPDCEYIEDAICIRPPSREQEKIESKIDNLTINKSNNYLDDKFMRKRKKLENVLGCIKTRKNIVNNDNDDCGSENLDVDLINDEMLSNLENMDIPIEPTDSNEIKIKKDDNSNEVPDEIAQKLEHNEISDVKNVVPENLPPLQRNPMHLNSIGKNINLARNKCDTIQDNDTVFDRNEIKINSMDSPVLDKESKDLDTISDTNIKFIDKVEDIELDDTSQIILDKIKKFFHEKEKKAKKEYITVYKIVDNDDKQEIKNDDQSKINYFYKKCKNVRKKNDMTIKESHKNESKTLALPNSEVKYCFKCSSIFETKECHYCAMSETRECVCDESQENRGDYSCDTCDLKSSDERLNCSK